jgi:hypothetical protein
VQLRNIVDDPVRESSEIHETVCDVHLELHLPCTNLTWLLGLSAQEAHWKINYASLSLGLGMTTQSADRTLWRDVSSLVAVYTSTKHARRDSGGT